MALKNEGLQTVESFSRAMNIQKNTAIRYMHELRIHGFVKSQRGINGKRLYEISPLKLKKIGSDGFFDILNENSSMKIQKPFEHRIYGRQMEIEEVIIRTLKTGDSRIILASLPLFKKVNDWSLLYKLAKNGWERHVGILYDLSRKYFRVKKMDGRIMRRLKEAPVHEKYIIGNIRSDDFKQLEREWKIHVPFNKSDIEKLGA